MSISTYFRPNIHQNGPGILGVKGYLIKNIQKTSKVNTRKIK
jgi:hypothetical protein